MLVAAWACLMVCIVSSHVGPTNGEKVLVVPSMAYSVYRSLLSIGEELLNKGHEVVVYQMEGTEKMLPRNNSIRAITYKKPFFNMKDRMAAWQELMAQVSVARPWIKTILSINHMSKSQQSACQFTLSDREAIQKIQDEKFDFVLIDGAVQNACFSVIPHVLKVPYGIYGGIVFTWPGMRPFRPLTEPTYFSPCTHPMSITDQVLNTVALVYQYFSFVYHLPIHYVNELAPKLSRVQTVNLLFSASIYLVNDYTFLGYVGPESSNEIQVGGILSRPAKPLPNEIQEFLDKSTKQVVVVAFGGSSVTDVPQEFSAKFERTWGKMNTTVLWKAGENKTDGNVMKRPWLPINDILAHPNTGVIIYHCGKNGFYEALYHGVPVICFPVMYDQPHYGARVEKLGIGKTLELASFTPDQLKDTINEVLNNPVYKVNAMKFSKIFHSFPQTSSEKGAYWVDHVIKHGADDLQLSSPPAILYPVILVGVFIASPILVFFCCCKLFKKKYLTNSSKRDKKD